MPHFTRFTTNHFSAAIVLFSFGLIFFISIHSTTSSHQAYLDSHKPWLNKSCVVNSSEVIECTRNPDKFTYAVTVNVLPTPTPPPAPNAVVARPSSDFGECPLSSRSDAEKILSDQYKPNSTVACYVAPDDDSAISLTAGSFSSIEHNKRRVRFIFSVISTIILGLIAVLALRRAVMVFAFPHRAFPADPFFSPRRPSMGPGASAAYAGLGLGFPTEPPLAGAANHAVSMRRPLPAAEARALAASMHVDPAHDADLVDDSAVCPICLEGLEGEAGAPLVRLPCSHVYHDECAAQWFRKGSPTCPYCNHTLSEELTRLRDEQNNTSPGSRRLSAAPRRLRHRDSRALGQDGVAQDEDEDKSADELDGAPRSSSAGAQGAVRARAQSSATQSSAGIGELAGQRHARRLAAGRRRAERDARSSSNVSPGSTGVGDSSA